MRVLLAVLAFALIAPAAYAEGEDDNNGGGNDRNCTTINGELICS